MQNEKPAFVTGYGQSDTRALEIKCRETGQLKPNPHESAGQPYATVTGADISKLLNEPPSVPKERGQWFIPSTYADHDARSHAAQKARGAFRWLTLDVDENDLDLSEIDAALSEVIGDAARMVYSSRGATETQKKWRALVPLKAEVPGTEFSDMQNAFFDLLEQASGGFLIPDRALSRPAQPIYLPNRGDLYQHAIHKGAGLLELTPDCAIMVHRAGIAADRAKAAQEAQEARERRAAQRKATLQGDDVSPVDHFNTAHSIADLLQRYGYTQARSSKDWKSPFQSSGSYATRDCGEFWISLSGSDDAQEIGQTTQNGHCFGDAFDLFCHFDHGGDFKAVVRAYAQEAGLDHPRRETLATGQRPKVQAQEQKEPDPDAPEPSSFEELLEAAKAMQPGQIEDMEAIIFECAALNPMRADAVFRTIKDAAKVPLGTIRAQLSQERDAIPEPDHLELARLTLDEIGRDNVICTDAFVWRWQGRGVWTQQEDRAIKQAVQGRLDNEAMIDVTASLVNGVTDVFKSDIYRPDHEFNLGNPETVNCLNGELELHGGKWSVRPHCREN